MLPFRAVVSLYYLLEEYGLQPSYVHDIFSFFLSASQYIHLRREGHIARIRLPKSMAEGRGFYTIYCTHYIAETAVTDTPAAKSILDQVKVVQIATMIMKVPNCCPVKL